MDAAIQAYIRSGMVRGRDAAQVGPFLATFSRRSANPYLNYAVPTNGATCPGRELHPLAA